MIETPARIVRVDGETAWVRMEAPDSCGACAGRGCGSSMYTRMLHPREPEYPVLNPIDAQPGEVVVVGVRDGAVLGAALSAYLVPLALLVGGALLAAPWGEAASVAGGAAGFLAAAVWLRRHGRSAQPVVLRRGSPVCRAH